MKTPDAPDEASGRPNKSQEKRETQALRDLVQQLIALPPGKLHALSLDDTLRAGVSDAKKMKRAALARQMRYLTGLMRQADVDLIARELEAMSRPHRREVQAFHRLEQWREVLIAGDERLLDDLVDRHGADRQQLRQLVRNARRERERELAPKAARLLFKYLADLPPAAGD